MARLGPTIAKLAALRKLPMQGGLVTDDALTDLQSFGANPGALRARTYVPDDLPAKSPLVVALHGCTQNAAGYNHGAGWSKLAAEQGFAVLLPEQQRSNNPNMCFNWFVPADTRRDGGEAQSIRQMIAAMVEAHDLDPQRIFVTGLSAGGAMTSVMLATYPEVFAGGAIIAGLPFGAAASVGDALSRMRGDGYSEGGMLADLVRDASAHRGSWPTISVWQGTGDTTVHPSNAQHIINQWRDVHGLGAEPSDRDMVDGALHRVWRDDTGRTVIESYEIVGMGHGTPLMTRGPDACGVAAPYMLEAGISSTRHIARSWGLIGEARRTAAIEGAAEAPGVMNRPSVTDELNATEEPEVTEEPAMIDRQSIARTVTHDPVRPRLSGPTPLHDRTRPASAGHGKGVGAIIEDALRAAGLMR